MLDRDLIEKLNTEERKQVEMALAMLSNSQIFDLQENRLLARLALGAETEDPEKLVERVLQYRADKSRLLSLRQLGDTINEEREDENQ